MYVFGETWYKLLPNPVESISPTIVKPLTKATWKHTNSSSLATSGIYSQSDLNKLRDHIMFPTVKPMILNFLAREITGHPSINQGIIIIIRVIKLIADTIIHGYALHRLFG